MLSMKTFIHTHAHINIDAHMQKNKQTYPFQAYTYSIASPHTQIKVSKQIKANEGLIKEYLC